MRVNLHYHELLNHTSFYRCLGPFIAMAEPKGAHTVRCLPSAPTWADVMQADVAFVHRPYLPEDLATIRKYKAYGVPVWIDYDDDFFGIPQSSPVYEKIAEARQNVTESLKAADIVTVSTACLKEVYAPIAKNVRVIPNAMPDQLAVNRPNRPARMKRIVWRGNATHARDINTVKDAVIRVALAHKDWDWIFLGGYRPWEICEEFTRNGIDFFVHPWIPDVYDYMRFLSKLDAAIMIVPLEDQPFNHAKSNIAWMEAAWANTLSLAPAWPEWVARGGNTYDDQYLFQDALEGMMDNKTALTTNTSWDYITKNLLLSKVNQSRERVLEELGGRV